MTCAICKNGILAPGLATVTLQRGPTTVVLKEVPAEICDNCGEHFLSEEITAKALAVANDAARKNAELQIIRFAA
jgi:YgiT-type zinc finger domain-containing protein